MNKNEQNQSGTAHRGVPIPALALANAFKPAAEAASRALEAFGAAWCSAAESEYLRHHRRLPGSNRTARLRKKRRAKVLAWFNHRISSANKEFACEAAKAGESSATGC